MLLSRLKALSRVAMMRAHLTSFHVSSGARVFIAKADPKVSMLSVWSHRNECNSRPVEATTWVSQERVQQQTCVHISVVTLVAGVHVVTPVTGLTTSLSLVSRSGKFHISCLRGDLPAACLTSFITGAAGACPGGVTFRIRGASDQSPGSSLYL